MLLRIYGTIVAKISEALKTDDCDAYASKAKAYRKLAQEIKKEFQTRYVDADGDLKQKSQTAYLLALKLDLFPTEEARKKGVETLVRKITGNGNPSEHRIRGYSHPESDIKPVRRIKYGLRSTAATEQPFLAV